MSVTKSCERILAVAAVSLACCLTVAFGQSPRTRPESFAGPWETTDPLGIRGIFLSLLTYTSGEQSITIRVYHREQGREIGGWYSMTPSEHAILDGHRLRFRTNDNGPVLDVTFDAQNQVWAGTWRQGEKLSEVVLERPRRSPGVEPSPFAGHWDGVPDATTLKAETRLHIHQSSDGVLTAWMNRVLVLNRAIVLRDQRHGELLRITSLHEGMITLESTPLGGAPYRYRATLSGDGSMLRGTWDRNGGGSLNAPRDFRRKR